MAASKFLGENIDFTLGLGWGKLSANSFNNPLTDLSESFNFRNSDAGLGVKISLKDFFSGPIGYLLDLNITFQNLKEFALN